MAAPMGNDFRISIADHDGQYRAIAEVPVRWGDPGSSPLEDIQSMMDKLNRDPLPYCGLWIPSKLWGRLHRFQLSRRAYRRWRGRQKSLARISE